MRQLALICLVFVSIQHGVLLHAQNKFPLMDGEPVKYSAYIEMSDAYLSGVCVLIKSDNVINGSLFNEFGITALDFTYYPECNKIKLHHVIKPMDKWYIRRVLRKDIAQLMINLKKGETEYRNEHRNILYQLKPITDDSEE